ncbi:hypothetical protein JHS3_19850 [Jeongeupia sp. HS-3]|uniref:DinB family protein n=1 Tax=Jeongeupia sp. HS-3 TaxID=1009682 RepID=UPI0018A676EC|nr:DinB family protein [Jeongeupia sp. HS-3]BCL76249.1 hypothetical protein JHS3_19850 [Jeongeupia sp. HS-3]
MKVLIVPGYGGSGPEHWQSRWQALHPDCIRVEQADWDAPDLEDWIARLDAAVAAAGPDTLIAAHSLGCLLVAHWAVRSPRAIAGALLVAVPDPAGSEFPAAAAGFGPAPSGRLPFAATVVASRDDPYAAWPFSERIATDWGAKLVDAGERGHLNADSDLGDWAEGWQMLNQTGRPDGLLGVAQVALFARYNAQMNAKLYSAAAQLSADELARDRGAFFGSLLGTLNHLIVGDTLWLQRFASHPGAHAAALAPVLALPKPASLAEIVCADFATLALRRQLLDEAISAWAAVLTSRELAEVFHYTSMTSGPGRKHLGDVLLHFFNHQTHHRGQATTLLSQAGIDVGATDLLLLVPNLD